MKVFFAVTIFVLLTSSVKLWQLPNIVERGCACKVKNIIDAVNKSTNINLNTLEKECVQNIQQILNDWSRQASDLKSSVVSYSILVETIKTKSNGLGIPNEGLISGRTRLRRLLQYYEDRHVNKIDQIQRLKNRKDTCKGVRQNIDFEMVDLKRNHTANNAAISALQSYYNCLEMQGKILQAKLNRNSPALHGSLGIMTGNVKDAEECVPPSNVDLITLSDNSKLDGF